MISAQNWAKNGKNKRDSKQLKYSYIDAYIALDDFSVKNLTRKLPALLGS